AGGGLSKKSKVDEDEEACPETEKDNKGEKEDNGDKDESKMETEDKDESKMETEEEKAPSGATGTDPVTNDQDDSKEDEKKKEKDEDNGGESREDGEETKDESKQDTDTPIKGEQSQFCISRDPVCGAGGRRTAHCACGQCICREQSRQELLAMAWLFGSKNQLKGRAFHRTVSVRGDSLYVWAGDQDGLPGVHDSEEKRRITSNIQHFTPSSGQWITRATTGIPPLGVRLYSCTAINDQLYYFGGRCGHDFCFHNSITQLDTVSLQWRELEPTDATRPVMRRSDGGMISFEHDGVHHLLMIGGAGSKPAVQLPHHEYIKFPDGTWFTNEHSMYNLSSRKWNNPSIIGQCIPPAASFIIEKINNTRAVLFGGVRDDAKNTDANNIYILEISISTVFWQCIKKPEAIDQWPVGRWVHAGAIIITGSDCPMLVISGGLDKNDILDDCWIFNITQHSWIKLDVPHSVSKRWAHSLSVFIVSPHCVWMITAGGCVDKRQVLVTNPNIVMITELGQCISHTHQ
ncbi:PREDICTED: uncharacterized protein LOC109588267, partial [Amphimedon queenslandica]|uniref:Uncharacterized protein n=1 Tax=Amphimedon queenslandica TaxID=400682 RepID=A0AAN0JSY0_AMPQE